VQLSRVSENKKKREKDELESHQKMEEKQKSGGFFY
jgi:hypothetical protein